MSPEPIQQDNDNVKGNDSKEEGELKAEFGGEGVMKEFGGREELEEEGKLKKEDGKEKNAHKDCSATSHLQPMN